MKHYWDRFLMWLLAPIYTRLLMNMEDIHKELACLGKNLIAMYDTCRQTQDVIGQLPSRFSVDAIGGNVLSLITMAEANNRNVGTISSLIQQAPRFTLGTMMAWEAIAYSADKYARDKEIHGIVPRDQEVMEWATAYLQDKEWPVPEKEVLAMLLDMRDRMFNQVTVHHA